MGETQENSVTQQNGQNPHLKYHLQLKTKEDVGGSGLGHQRRGRQFTGPWRNKCLVNKCLRGPAETMRLRVDSDIYVLQRFLHPHLAHILCRYLW